MKRVLITGGTRGIGLACCQRFSRAGYAVTALYARDEAAADRARKRLKDVEFLRADVRDERGLEAVFARFDTLDVLVNNAGISAFGQVQDTALSKWEQVLSVNAGGVFLCTRFAVPKFLKRGGGAIVNLASIWGETGGSCESVYSASKGAVIAFTKALAKELAPAGITVNSVSPGAIETEMNARLSAEEKRLLCEEIPLGRFGTPEEVAELVFFVSEQKYLTGQDIALNGGWYC